MLKKILDFSYFYDKKPTIKNEKETFQIVK